MEPSTLLVQVLNGLQFGMLLFLIASGLTLTFGVMGIINLVNRQLSQRTIIDLNAAVELDERDPADVADQFLRQRGLLDTDSG